MEKWELIADYTVEETAISVDIDKDINGNEFELKKLSVMVITPASETESYLGVSVYLEKNYNFGMLVGQTPKATENKCIGFVSFANLGFGLSVISCLKSLNYTNACNNLVSQSANNTFASVNDANNFNTPETCTNVRVGSNWQKSAVKGTRIIVKGVRV